MLTPTSCRVVATAMCDPAIVKWSRKTYQGRQYEKMTGEIVQDLSDFFGRFIQKNDIADYLVVSDTYLGAKAQEVRAFHPIPIAIQGQITTYLDSLISLH